MKIQAWIGLLLAAALLLPQVAEAKTKKKASAPSQRSERIGRGPLGPFVDAPDKQVFLNILGFAHGLPTIGYEQMLGDDNSFTAQAGLKTYGGGGFSMNFLGVVGSYRWWIGRHASMQGFYAGPQATVQTVNVNYDVVTTAGKRTESATSMIFGAGGEGGYQWIFPGNFTVSAGLNAGYYFGSLNVAAGGPSIPFGGVGTGLNGTVGYAF